MLHSDNSQWLHNTDWLLNRSGCLFRRILNNLNKKKEANDINLDSLYNFFKDLNENKNDSLGEDDFYVQFDEETEETLNCSITEEEILK